MRDTKEILTCPACGKKMHKVFIKETGFNLDICLDGCGGILFDNREFKYFDEQHENISEILEAIADKEFTKKDESKTRICPICDTPMVKHFASSLQQVEMDECYSCGAIFLDHGELSAIREQFETEQERSDAFNKHFTKENASLIQTINLEHKEGIENRSKGRKIAVSIVDEIIKEKQDRLQKERQKILDKINN